MPDGPTKSSSATWQTIRLQASANLADAEYAAFRQKKAPVDQLYEEHPFDPEVQRMKEELDELAKQFPKE